MRWLVKLVEKSASLYRCKISSYSYGESLREAYALEGFRELSDTFGLLYTILSLEPTSPHLQPELQILPCLPKMSFSNLISYFLSLGKSSCTISNAFFRVPTLADLPSNSYTVVNRGFLVGNIDFEEGRAVNLSVDDISIN